MRKVKLILADAKGKPTGDYIEVADVPDDTTDAALVRHYNKFMRIFLKQYGDVHVLRVEPAP